MSQAKVGTAKLEIKDFQSGIGFSPHVGFGDMRNLDIYTKPGVIRINNALVKQSGTVVVTLPQWFVKNPKNTSEIFALDSAQKVYHSTDSGATWTLLTGNNSGNGQGLAIWKDYLIVPRNTTLDLYGPLSSSPGWVLSFQTIDSDTIWHPLIVSKNDGNLYGGAGRFIFKLLETVGSTFDPGNAATYTFDQQALDLLENYRVKCLVELGENLMIGTWMGSNTFDFKIADIFPWDRNADSFGDPISIAENGINSMVVIASSIYIAAGVQGKIYVSNGIQVSDEAIAQIPYSIADLEGGKYLEILPGAMVNHKGRLHFGVSAVNGNGAGGVWSLRKTSKGYVLNFDNLISTGNDGSVNVLTIGALLSMTQDVLLAGWVDNTTCGIDRTDLSNRYSSYSAYAESPFFKVGDLAAKEALTDIQEQLVKVLQTNEGVRLKYRKRLSDSYTLIQRAMDFATDGAITGMKHSPTGISDAEFLQIKIELTGTSTTPELRSVVAH